jgi:hypothetical protein
LAPPTRSCPSRSLTQRLALALSLAALAALAALALAALVALVVARSQFTCGRY